MMREPWSDIGTLQRDVSRIKQDLHNKADNHEVLEIKRKVDSMERTMREISTNVDELRYRVEDAENKINELEAIVYND